MASGKKQRKYQVIINSKPAIEWKSKNFTKIMQFYLIETPAFNGKQDALVSRRGRTFKSYGWEGGDKFANLLQEMKKASTNLSRFETVSNAPVKSKATETFPPNEYCLFVAPKYITNHLLRAIRNSLAHGEIYQLIHNKKRIYVLQNHHGGLQAEIVLCEETLLKWIDIIKAGPVAKEK